MNSGQQIDLADNGPQGLVVTPVGAFPSQNQLPHRPLLQPMPDVRKICVAHATGIPGPGSSCRLRGHNLCLGPLAERLHSLSAVVLYEHSLGNFELPQKSRSEPFSQSGIIGQHIFFFGLADLLHQFVLHRAQFTNNAVGFLNRLKHSIFWHLSGKALDHQNGRFAARYNQIQIAFLKLILGRKCHELTVDLSQSHAAQWAAKRQRRHAQSRRSTVHSQHIAVVLLVARQYRRLNLHFVEEAVWKKRTDRTIHQTTRERFLHRGPPLSLQEPTRKLAACCCAFAVIARKREKINTQPRGASCGRHNHARLAKLYKNATCGLLCQKTRFHTQNSVAKFSFNSYFQSYFPSFHIVLRAACDYSHTTEASRQCPRTHMMPEPDTYRAGVRPRTRDVPALKDDRTTNAKHTRPTLLTNIQPLDNVEIPLRRDALEIVEKPAPTAHHHQQTTPAGEILGVLFEVASEMRNSS